MDDAIVVVENIVRHFRCRRTRAAAVEVAVEAVDEVGNPTILATFAVIAAILPMAFVRGLMGPYMRPIPVGASAAMLFSLLIAFIVSPWAALRLLQPVRRGHADGQARSREELDHPPLPPRDEPLIQSPTRRWRVPGGVVVLLWPRARLSRSSCVTVKMLPFDNKSEFQVIIDMPEGTTLEQTAARHARARRRTSRTVPEVTDYEIYVGTARRTTSTAWCGTTSCGAGRTWPTSR